VRSQLNKISEIFEIETDIVAQTVKVRFQRDLDLEAALNEAAKKCDKLEDWRFAD
jgi:hypothetical protein